MKGHTPPSRHLSQVLSIPPDPIGRDVLPWSHLCRGGWEVASEFHLARIEDPLMVSTGVLEVWPRIGSTVPSRDLGDAHT